MISKACSSDDGITLGLDDDKKLNTTTKSGTVNTQNATKPHTKNGPAPTPRRLQVARGDVAPHLCQIWNPGSFSDLSMSFWRRGLRTSIDRTDTHGAAPSALSELLGGSPNQKCCHDLISRRQSPASCLPAFLLHNNNNDARERHTEVTSESSTRAISPNRQHTSKNFPARANSTSLISTYILIEVAATNQFNSFHLPDTKYIHSQCTDQ